jgi:hypothetical protein
MTAILEMGCTLMASIDVDLKLTIVPIFIDRDHSDDLSFFLIIFVQSMILLMADLWHNFLHIFHCDIIQATLDSIERVDLNFLKLSALKRKGLISKPFLFSLLSRH